MTKSCSSAIFAVLTILTAAIALPLAAATFFRPTMPGVESLIIDCGVTADRGTANCGFRPSSWWKPSARDRAVLKDVAARPEHLAGAIPGARVEVIVRRAPGMRADAADPAAPPDWAPPPPSADPSPIIDPIWTVLPTANSLKDFYPDRAFRLGVSGDAAATCAIGPAGDLVGCWLSNEQPPEQEFGNALLRITTCLQVGALTKSGSPSPGRTIKVAAHFTVRRRDFAVQMVLLGA